MTQIVPPARDTYRWFLPIQTRWIDNDVYGHVNNAVYYAYFDTVINAYLIGVGALDIHHGPTVGLCVESQCRYIAPAAYPEPLEGGLVVAHLGRSSVRYEVGIFRAHQADGDGLSAFGHFVHVFVDRVTRRSVPMPDSIRTALERIRTP